MTYYYATFNDQYEEIDKLHSSGTMKNALKGLRNLMVDIRCQSGIIMDSNMRPVGEILAQVSKRKVSIELPNGRTVRNPGIEYRYYPKGKKTSKLVMSDGSLRVR